jgi:hypothetical protein
MSSLTFDEVISRSVQSALFVLEEYSAQRSRVPESANHQILLPSCECFHLFPLFEVNKKPQPSPFSLR